MKPIISLFLAVLLWTNISFLPDAAAGSTINNSLSSALNSTQISTNPANSPSFTYLPITYNYFHPTCIGIPENLLGLFGDSLIAYYPLWELSGNTAVDVGPNHFNGIYEGKPALNQIIALCGNAPAFDGMNDSVNILSQGLATAFNGSEGTAIIQLKIERSEWVDGRNDVYLALRADDNNQVVLQKTAENQLEFSYTASGKKLAATYKDIATTKWLTYAITWSKSNDRFLGYLAGASICPEPVDPVGDPICPPQDGLGSWAMELTSAEIGGFLGSSVHYARGSISSLVLLNHEATPGEIRQYSSIFGATQVLSIIGDSIARVFYSSPWPVQTVFEYQGGNRITLKSHAVSARGILLNPGMDAQVQAAALDDADIIILAMGAVDDNNSDMAALQAEVEENIAELKLSNPRAAIYYLNVLPCWTDQTGKTEQDKSRIRAAISAACESQGIPCWDSHTIPWITAADTSDGVHLTATGQAKVAAQVLLRIQAP